MASDFDAMRLADLLEHEARAHGPTDYKHKAAAMLRSLATQPTASPEQAEAPSVPADVLKYAKSMQKQGYSGPLMWARTIIDWVADQEGKKP